MALVCSTFEVSRAAWYAARKPKTPKPSPRIPAAPRFAPAEVVLAAIRKVVEVHVAWGVRKVWATLRRDGLRVGYRRVWAIMKANHLVLSAPERRPALPRGQVVTPRPNRRWATDFTTVWTRKDGVVAVVLTADCGCRSALDVTVTKSQEAPAVLGSVEYALERFLVSPQGVPHGLELRSDHGPQYTGADARELVARWRLTHTFAPVGRPTGNAVAERIILTMKEECIWLADWDSAAELDAALQAWRLVYNNVRPHQALGWRTPTEQRIRHLGSMFTAAHGAA